MPSTREDRADHVDLPRPRVGHVVDEPDLGQHDRDHDDLEAEPDTPRQVRRHEAPEQRPDRGSDRGSGPDQRVCPRPSRSLEVPVDQGLHRGQQQRRPSPPMIAQKTMIAVRLWASVIARAPIA